MAAGNGPRSLLGDSLRAHALVFERPLAPTYPDDAGNRMLIAFLAVAVGLFLGMRWVAAATGARGWPPATLAFVVVLVGAFASAQRAYVGLPLAEVGMRPLADWTRREQLYFLQVVPLAAIAFAIVFRAHLRALLDQHGLVGFLVYSLLTGLVWGVAQEFLYRGWLQTELTRRFGAVAGWLAANAAFAFGPLHLSYFAKPGGVDWLGLIPVFGIGLFFGLVYRRSGNLWIPAVMHGLWPLNMT